MFDCINLTLISGVDQTIYDIISQIFDVIQSDVALQSTHNICFG